MVNNDDIELDCLLFSGQYMFEIKHTYKASSTILIQRLANIIR